MPKYIYGKHGRDAVKQFAKDLHYKQIHGKLPRINKREEEQIIERAKVVYGKDGKMPYKILERDFVKQVLNPLAVRKDDFFDSGEVGEISKGFNFTEHTKQVGSKYSETIRAQKREEARQKEKMKIESRNEARIIEEKKSSAEKSRLDEIRNKISASKNNYSNSPYGGVQQNNPNQYGGIKPDNSFAANSKYGGMAQNNPSPYSLNNSRFGGMANNNNPNINNIDAQIGGARSGPASANKPGFLKTIYDKFIGGGSPPKSGGAENAGVPPAGSRDNTNSDYPRQKAAAPKMQECRLPDRATIQIPINPYLF